MPLTADFTIKRGDAGKVISGQFQNADKSIPNLTGSITRKVIMTNISTGVKKIDGATFTFSDAALAKWTYSFSGADVDTSGWYKLEFEVTRVGFTDTFPTDPDEPYLTVLIQDDLG